MHRCLVGVLLVLGCLAESIEGFSKNPSCMSHGWSKQCASLKRKSSAALHSSFFSSLENFFNGGNNDDDDDNLNNDEVAGTNRLVTIPVKSVKPGGLRLFLMFYLMGMQNTPDRNSWRADQPSSEDYVVDFFFHDQTALLSIHLNEDEVTIDRVGSSPSTVYLMQESVVIEGILNELDLCAFDDKVAVDDRLLVLKEPQDAIERARDSLAFA